MTCRLRTVDPEALPREPWRNGAGTTRVLAADGSGWRVSLADLDRAAVFSAFPGVDRSSVVVSGAGLALVVDGVPVSAGLLEVVAYDGAADVRAELVDGPVVNLNLMVSRARGGGRMRVFRCSGQVTCSPPVVATVLVDGAAALPDGRSLRVLETVLLDGGPVTLTTRGALLVELSVVPLGEAA